MVYRVTISIIKLNAPVLFSKSYDQVDNTIDKLHPLPPPQINNHKFVSSFLLGTAGYRI